MIRFYTILSCFWCVMMMLMCQVFRLISEYDECKTDAHGCDHFCVNTLGSFTCQCKLGYELHSDGKKCEGKSLELRMDWNNKARLNDVPLRSPAHFLTLYSKLAQCDSGCEALKKGFNCQGRKCNPLKEIKMDADVKFLKKFSIVSICCLGCSCW